MSNKQLGTSDVKEDAYILIPHRFVLRFSGQKLLAYSLIYSMCKNSESQSFYASNNYLATRIGCNIPSANRIIHELVDEGYLNKSETTNSSGSFTYTLGKQILEDGTVPKEQETFIDFDEYVPEQSTKTVKVEEKEKTINPKTKSTKIIKEYINTQDFTEEVKNTIFDWYYSVAVGKIQLNTLQEKLKDIIEKCNNDMSLVQQSIHQSKVNNWFGFYPVKNINAKQNENKQYWNTTKEVYEKSNEVF